MDKAELLIDGVFEGGGAKGLAHIGALQELESRGYWFKRVAGTSAGAWIAALIACGYRALPTNACSLGVILDLEQSFLKDGWLQLPLNLLIHGGLFFGHKLTDTLDGWLKEGLGFSPNGPSPTFADLKNIELYVVASCLTSHEVVVFSRDTTPDLAIARAVRMSSSLPFLYVPHEWPPSEYYRKQLQIDTPQLVVDGGVVSTFPMFIFKEPNLYVPRQTKEDQQRPTLGFNLVETEDPNLTDAQRDDCLKRAKHVRSWRTTLILLLLIGPWVVGYIHLFYEVFDKSIVQPIFGDESLFSPIDAALGAFPGLFRGIAYFLIHLPRLLFVCLPIIILILIFSRPYRLIWQVLGFLGLDKKHVRSKDVMDIYIGPYTTCRFNLSPDQRQDLIQRGKDAVRNFIPQWEKLYGFSSRANSQQMGETAAREPAKVSLLSAEELS